MEASISGPGISGLNKYHIVAVDSHAAYVVLTLPKLELDATYKIHLFDPDSPSVPLSVVSLDLEYLVQYASAQSMKETKATTAGDSWLDAFNKTHEAKKIERQTAANQRLAVAKVKALAVQRELYLLDHPDVKPTLDSVSSDNDDLDNEYPSSNSYCKIDSAAEKTYVRVRRSVVDPKEASDSYGRRLGRRFLVFEVTVENNNPSLQYLLHDVSVDLSRMNNMPPGTYHWSFSSQDLIMLRGVPEKGSDYDPRNLTFHIARGVGAVAGGVTGLTSPGIQDLFGGVTAAFNGPVLSSFIDIFPDHTATQLNRLSDSVFTTNTVVAKQSAKTFAIFVPQGIFLTHAEQSSYWKEPISVFGNPALDFRQADVCVDGAFISEVSGVTLAAASYDTPDAVLPGATKIPVTLTGSNFSVGDTIVDIFGKTFTLETVDADSITGHVYVDIPADWDWKKNEEVTVESKKSGEKTPPITLVSPQTPLLSKVTFAEPTKAAANQSVKLNIIGHRFISGDTQLQFLGLSPINLTNVTDATSGQVTLAPADYDATKSYQVTLISRSTGSTSNSQPLATAKAK